ncbi:PEP/pyruvate-binding domain-containing protein [Verrucomicrobium spinosum]|uniref:PEP/pyruvate-binding domain-containing protein n=1 Tax=Verrucomicrobium spinosum TaxID=2736 RepID=UPI000AB558BE|nr:PEP/pyruvate-binding domain-containing protein [Verrucomicrobium spinosum]
MVVTTLAYQEFVSGLGEVLAQAADLSAGDPVRLQQGGARLREELARAPLPEAVAAEVRQSLAARPAGQAYSVRSSSNLEDLASAAFAGQHDTFLNVIGTDEVLAKVKACFLSLWHDRAIAYRREHGFDHTHASMAVVIQQMVPCDVAGVAFSINPVNGDLGTIVVDANYGLGESVVSGEAEVDHFELDKATGTVKSRTVAAKSHMVVSSDQGTVDRVVDDAAACCACLSDAQLAELAALLVRVERHYRFPQDIEWGLLGGTLHLLQSRPITTIPPKWTRTSRPSVSPMSSRRLPGTSWRPDFTNLSTIPSASWTTRRSAGNGSPASVTTSMATRMPCDFMRDAPLSTSPTWRICWGRCPGCGRNTVGCRNCR